MLVSVLTSNIMQDLRIALIFGLTVFSGAGCISIGVLLDDKLKTITKVYVAVLILATFTAIFLPLVVDLIFPYFYLFTSLILISLGMELIGINLEIKPQTILKIGLLISLLYSLKNLSIDFAVKINYHALVFVLASVGIGYLATLFGSIILDKKADLKTLRTFSGACLILLGVKIAGLPVYSWIIFLTYGIGVIAGLIQYYFRWGKVFYKHRK